MKHYITPFLTLTLLIQGAFGVPVIDLSKDHSIERVKESGAEYKVFESRIKFIRITKQDLIIRLPGGRSYSMRVDRSRYSYDDEGIITSASFYTEVMPTEEAAELMRIFKRSFSYSTTDVDRWLADVDAGKDSFPFKFKDMGYGTAIGENYPKIQFLSKSSANPIYKWNFALNLEWHDRDYPEGWNETQAAIQNPKPPAGYEVVSLNPPSGRFYSRKEGLEIAYDIDLDKKPEVNAEPSKANRPEPTIEETTKIVTAEPKEETIQKHANWWLWLIGAVIVVGGIVLLRPKR